MDVTPTRLPDQAFRWGQEAYRRSSLYRDMVDLCSRPEYLRIQQRLRDPAIADEVQMFLRAHGFLCERFPQASSLECLGLLDQGLTYQRPPLLDAFHPRRQPKKIMEGEEKYV